MTKINVDVPLTQEAVLEWLMKESGAVDHAELVSMGLNLLKWSIVETSKGRAVGSMVVKPGRWSGHTVSDVEILDIASYIKKV